MNPSRIWAIARQDLRILRTDPTPLVILIVMPLLMMPFLKPAFSAALHLEGRHSASGAEQVVPGMAVTFGFFLVGDVSLNLFREHSWRTWSRLLASPAGTSEVLLGKLLTPLFQALCQFVVLFGLGGLVMGLQVEGSWFAVVAVGIAFGLFLVTSGLAIASLCRTVLQANAIVNLGTLVCAGLAGALVPYGLLPGWAQALAPAIPSYWAMQGYERAIFDGGMSVLLPISVLLGFSGLALGIAAIRFRFDDVKVGRI